VMTAGRMAIFQDTTGAFIAAWQPNDHIGAQLVNEAGSFTWGELSTSDLAKSKAFYSEVFGWGWGGVDEYSEAQVAGRTVAGVMPRPPGMPADTPDNWLVYFGTSDVDADVKRAQDLGATVIVEPTDIPRTGRFAVLLDAQNAAFGLFQG
jgi:predicted enzyme related to lactoylglutathione lyase